MEGSIISNEGSLARNGSMEGAPKAPTSKGYVLIEGGLAEAPVEQILPSVAHASLTSKDARTWRSRALGFLACALALAIALGTASVFSARSSAYAASVESVQTEELVVQSGDSLWAIAREHAVEGLTTAQVVDLLLEWNDLSNSTLQPGMELVVPAQG